MVWSAEEMQKLKSQKFWKEKIGKEGFHQSVWLVIVKKSRFIKKQEAVFSLQLLQRYEIVHKTLWLLILALLLHWYKVSSPT